MCRGFNRCDERLLALASPLQPLLNPSYIALSGGVGSREQMGLQNCHFCSKRHFYRARSGQLPADCSILGQPRVAFKIPWRGYGDLLQMGELVRAVDLVLGSY